MSTIPAADEALPADYEISTIDGDALTYATAYERFFAPNLPFIAISLTDDWPACRDWVSADAGEPNWDLLQKEYGQAAVGVVDCSLPEDERLPDETTFGEVVRMWKRGEGKDLYIKDWHLRRHARRRACPGDTEANEAVQIGQEEKKRKIEFYTVPHIFSDDWMDSYYTDCKEDDFAFVYFGTQGTGTPLHRDVCEHTCIGGMRSY